MKKIIVPLDFSSCADNALRNAITIAERMNMELLLLHSYIVPVAAVEHSAVMLTQEIELSEKQTKDRFNELESDFPELSDIPHSFAVEGGTLLDSIRAWVKTGDVAMIVMGTHGASGLQRALLGSNAYTIMKHVKCPVIALPEDASLTGLKHIALGGDYKSVPTADCLKPVIDMARAFYADIQVIHIDQDKNLDHEEMEKAKGIEKYLKNVNHSFHFRTDYDVEDGLINYAKEHNVKLLAMISRHHSLLDRLTHGSETKRMAMDIPMPLMVLHE